MVAPESVRRPGPVAYAMGLRTALAVGLLVFGAVDLAAIHTVLLPHYLGSRFHSSAARWPRAQPPPLPAPPREPTSAARVSNQSPPEPAPAVPSQPQAPVPVVRAETESPPAPAPAAPSEARPLAPAPVPDEARDEPNPENKDWPRLLFIRNTAWLSPEARGSLATLAGRLKDDPTLEVVLAGHTDDLGTPEINRMLSLRRALRARAWLVEHGVALDRIEVRGLGSSQPALSGNSNQARTLNRRVEIIVSERSH